MSFTYIMHFVHVRLIYPLLSPSLLLIPSFSHLVSLLLSYLFLLYCEPSSFIIMAAYRSMNILLVDTPLKKCPPFPQQLLTAKAPCGEPDIRSLSQELESFELHPESL